MHIMTGKDLIDSHIIKFYVENGAWYGELIKKDEQFLLLCKDGNTIVNTLKVNENSELDLYIKPIKYEKDLLQEEIDECNRALFNRITGIVPMMEKQGYKMKEIEENVIVKEYMNRINTAKTKLAKLYEESKQNEMEDEMEK